MAVSDLCSHLCCANRAKETDTHAADKCNSKPHKVVRLLETNGDIIVRAHAIGYILLLLWVVPISCPYVSTKSQCGYHVPQMGKTFLHKLTKLQKLPVWVGGQ